MKLRFAAATFVALICGAATAHASPSLNFNVTVWNAHDNSSLMADPSRSTMANNDEVSSFNFAGMPNWSDASSNGNTLSDFLGSGPGTISDQHYYNGNTGSDPLSTSSLGTLFDLQFTATQNIAASIENDNAMSLWGDNSNSNLFDNSGGTWNNFDVGPGSYNLWCIETNGSQPHLTIKNVSVPEPASLAILATGLVALGLVLRRRKAV